MKNLLFIMFLCSAFGAETLPPSIPGQRVVVEISSDMQTWILAMPYNSPRGFLRARTETCGSFATWIQAADASPAGDLAIISNGARNQACWGAVLDLTPLSLTTGVLVSPCHVLFSTHNHPVEGSALQWMTPDGQIVSRTLLGLASLPDTAYLYPDFTIGRIDADVPNQVGFASVLDGSGLPDWEGYCVPVVIRDQFNDLHEADVLRVTSAATHPYVYLTTPLAPHRAARFKQMVSGDSGSPVCLVQDGKLMLLTIVTTGGDGRGAYISAHIDAINAAMTALGGGHQLSIQSTND